MANSLKLGDYAPDFTLSDKDQSEVSLGQVETSFKVVYFYPKDNTPGCTIQAIQFSKDLKKFKSLDTEIIGISGGDAKSKALFCKKNKLTVTLLSDTDFEVAKKYGVFGEKFFMERKYLGISRVTFLLDDKNRIIKIYEKASPEENSAEIIAEIKKLAGRSSSEKASSKGRGAISKKPTTLKKPASKTSASSKDKAGGAKTKGKKKTS